MKNRKTKPNIILINCDDLGYGDLGCYGSEQHTTPAIDRMAEEGIRFTDFYMAAPVCSASRAAMLTGCYPKRLNFPGVLMPADTCGLHPDEITFARLLRDHGYATKLVGKWHLGDQPEFLPTRHGFDSYYGLPYSNDMGRNKGDGPNKPPLPLMDDEEVIQQQPDQEGLTERYLQEAVRFIREKQEGPFFLYLAQKYVHVPIYVQQRFMQQSRNGLYGGAVGCLDWSVDVILQELASLGIEEETLVIFTSDNGGRWSAPESCRPLKGHKASTWEGGLRVPCIMRWKGVLGEGQVCTALTTAMDFYPTLAKLGGAEIPADRVIDGKDITDLMASPQDAASPYEAFYYYNAQTAALDAVRCGDWKLFVCREGVGVAELYNLQDDIGEENNVFAEHPDIVKKLMAHIETARQELGDTATGAQGKNTRPCGYVANPQPLTHYAENHPYMIEEYDGKDERV